MKSLRYFTSTLLVLTAILSSGFSYHRLGDDGYVQFKGEHVTTSELRDLNFSDVKDTNDIPIPNKEIGAVYVIVKRGSELRRDYIGKVYASKIRGTSLVASYRSMMDTLLPSLNLMDTIYMEFELYDTPEKSRQLGSKDQDEEEYVLLAYGGVKKIYQMFVVSSQTVVDLKRNPMGNGMVAYPSPTKELVSVKFDIRQPLAGKIELVNSMGQLISSVDHPNLMEPCTFNVMAQPAGTYILRTRIDGEYFTQKFIKE